LLRGRLTAPEAGEPPPLIEIHTTSTTGGVTERRLLLRTDDEDVLDRALDRFSDGCGRHERLLEWDDPRGEWVEP
jgi:hypothetical protein